MGFARRLVLVMITTAILSAVVAGAAGAAVICWSGQGGDGRWETASNWVGGVVPGANDEAELSAINGGCNPASTVTVSTNRSIGSVGGVNNTLKVASPGTLTFAGTSPDGQGVSSVDVADGARITIARGARVDSSGGWDLHSTGAVTVDGTLASAFSNLLIQGGSLAIDSGAKLLVVPTLNLTIQNTKFDMQGTVDLTAPGHDDGGTFFIGATAASPVSTGTWIGNAGSWFRGAVIGGVTYTITGPVSGRWSAQQASGGNGPAVIKLAGSAACPFDDLDIYGTAGFELDRDCTVAGKLTLYGSSYRYSGRNGTGTLTAASAEIDGGGFFDTGLTKVTGATNIIGNSGGPAIYNGATLRTEGPTTWRAGFVALGASNQTGPGTWENAGALRIDNANAGGNQLGLIDASPDFRSGGTLKNLAGATITRTAPTGTFPISARIENAGRIDVQAGAMGGQVNSAYPYGSLVQSGGETRVASGATLDLDTTLNGGTLKGNGTVRSVANPGGTVAPGESPGALTISTTFTQGPGGTLLEDIAGLAPASFDRLLVAGAATLGGTVKIVKDPAYAPAGGDTYNILTAASRTGEFAALTGDGGFTASYRADGTTLTYGSGSGTPTGGGGGGGTPTGGGDTTPSGGRSGRSGGGSATLSGGGSTPAGPVGGSGGTTRPVPSAPAPRTVNVATIATLPSAKSCASRRDFAIRLRIPKGKRVTSAEVGVAGRRATVLKGRRLTARVRLTGLPKGTFKVTITLTLADGSRLQGSRTYHTCVPGRKA